MPSSSLALNTSSSTKLDFSPSHQYQWKRWILPILVLISFGCRLIVLLFPNTLAAAVAAGISLSIAAVCIVSLIIFVITFVAALIAIIIKTISSDKTNQELPLPTYEEIKQADEKELPSYEEALEKEKQAKLGMNPSQPISSEKTGLVSGEPPPYGTFFDNSNSLLKKPTPFQPDIELTEIKLTIGSAGLNRG